MTTLEGKNAQLRRTKSLLWQVGVLGTIMDEKIKQLNPLGARILARHRAKTVGGRLERTRSPEDPAPEYESADPPGTPSSNESSVDPWEVAPHKRPVNIPPKAPKPPGQEASDRVEVVQDLSDREDDAGEGVEISAERQSVQESLRGDQQKRGRKRPRGEISKGEEMEEVGEQSTQRR